MNLYSLSLAFSLKAVLLLQRKTCYNLQKMGGKLKISRGTFLNSSEFLILAALFGAILVYWWLKGKNGRGINGQGLGIRTNSQDSSIDDLTVKNTIKNIKPRSSASSQKGAPSKQHRHIRFAFSKDE